MEFIQLTRNIYFLFQFLNKLSKTIFFAQNSDNTDINSH